MFTIEKKEEILPVCPHCKTELSKMWCREIKGDLGKRSIYFCSNCKSLLGVSHRKGLTFGW